jgi:DNA-binding NtrC family response regulator
MIGEHPLMREVYRLVRRVAPTDLPVLIVGETGTGKELVARAVHELSGRAGKYVALNVCAVGDTMFEDALFGHVRGGFTGAVADAPGYLLEGNGGTVFFDEIGSLPLAAQGKLLRAIETGEFRPVGGRADRRSDFRVVAATNADLRELVRDGRFRRDLFERLHGLVIALPPLRERAQDIPLLATSFLAELDHGGLRFTDQALAALVAYQWPGNVRELVQSVELMAIGAETSTIGADAVSRACAPAGVTEHDRCRVELAGFLLRVDWDVERAASDLGMSRATLYRRLRELGLRRPRPSHIVLRRLETT